MAAGGTTDPCGVLYRPADFDPTKRMDQALIDANTTFDRPILPGQPHSPQGAAGRYYRGDVRRFMATHVGGPR